MNKLVDVLKVSCIVIILVFVMGILFFSITMQFSTTDGGGSFENFCTIALELFAAFFPFAVILLCTITIGMNFCLYKSKAIDQAIFKKRVMISIFMIAGSIILIVLGLVMMDHQNHSVLM